MPPSPPSGDRDRFRETSRAPLETAVKLQVDAFEEPIAGLTANVSKGGMFVASEAPRPVGTLARFELDLAGAPVGGTAEVVWIRARAQGPGQPAGMGLEFRLLEEGGHERVRSAVLQRLEELGLPLEPDTGLEVLAQRRARPGASPSPSPSRPPRRRQVAAGRRAAAAATSGSRRRGLAGKSKRWIVAAILFGLLLLLLRLVG